MIVSHVLWLSRWNFWLHANGLWGQWQSRRFFFFQLSCPLGSMDHCIVSMEKMLIFGMAVWNGWEQREPNWQATQWKRAIVELFPPLLCATGGYLPGWWETSRDVAPHLQQEHFYVCALLVMCIGSVVSPSARSTATEVLCYVVVFQGSLLIKLVKTARSWRLAWRLRFGSPSL